MKKASALALLCIAAPLSAHPHIFVDTSVRFDIADGLVQGIEVTWSYDPFFTLLIFEDMGLDPDGDAVLTAQELDQLRGFDLIEWPSDFDGDIYLTAGANPVALSLPQATGIAVTEGQIVASHYRSLPNPVSAAALDVFSYDPTFYVQYRLSGDIIVPSACAVTLHPFDQSEADRKAEEIMGGLQGDAVEIDYEALGIGHLYADRAAITCASS